MDQDSYRLKLVHAKVFNVCVLCVCVRYAIS